VYRGKLILYGCGDLLNDYEGIRGHESYRPELGFLYFPTLKVDPPRLESLELVPTRIARFQINQAREEERDWLRERMNDLCAEFGHQGKQHTRGDLILQGSRASE